MQLKFASNRCVKSTEACSWRFHVGRYNLISKRLIIVKPRPQNSHEPNTGLMGALASTSGGIARWRSMQLDAVIKQARSGTGNHGDSPH
jgi:hypothetical protein